jgi:glutamyl-Q tRNA(Asp) synthetase
MDDLDQTRCPAGAADRILAQLTDLGLHWDGEIRWQSRCQSEYAAAFERLRSNGLLFRCDCTRQKIRAVTPELAADDIDPVCVGDCQRRCVTGEAAWRVDLSAWLRPQFEDCWQGVVPVDVRANRDRVVLRRDGVFAYHLTVVVDDLASGVTDVVRGADLLDSVAVQSAIYRALGAPCPRYAHCPVVVAHDGSKLAKSQHSLALETGRKATALLARALHLLSQSAAIDLDQVQPAQMLENARAAWSPIRFHGRRSQALPTG